MRVKRCWSLGAGPQGTRGLHHCKRYRVGANRRSYSLTALALVITAIAFVSGRIRRPEARPISKAEVMRLLPSVIGAFRIVASTDDPNAYELGTYRDNHGNLADLLVAYGARSPHDSVGCYWSRGQDPSWQQLIALKSLNSPAVFDVGIFRDRADTARLVASTECWPDECRETLYVPFHGWLWPSRDVCWAK